MVLLIEWAIEQDHGFVMNIQSPIILQQPLENAFSIFDICHSPAHHKCHERVRACVELHGQTVPLRILYAAAPRHHALVAERHQLLLTKHVPVRVCVCICVIVDM